MDDARHEIIYDRLAAVTVALNIYVRNAACTYIYIYIYIYVRVIHRAGSKLILNIRDERRRGVENGTTARFGPRNSPEILACTRPTVFEY